MIPNEDQIKSFSDDFQLIENEIKIAIIGQQNIIRNVVVSMIVGGNVLLEGLPGLGKTQLVKAIGKTLDLNFSRIQFTPDLMPADVTGTIIFVKKSDGTGEFEFQKGPIFSNILLADEINRATPKTQSALLEAMQERTVTVGSTTHNLPAPFFVIATQNPLEMEGTYPLPEAQMDRFMFKLMVTFPNQSELLGILDLTTGSSTAEPQNVYGADKIMQLREVAKAVPVSKPVFEYVADLILRSHPDQVNAPEMVKKYVRYGSSPRGAQALITSAKVYALLDGRFNVSYVDVKSLAHDVLRHRVFLNFEALSDGVTIEQIIDELLK